MADHDKSQTRMVRRRAAASSAGALRLHVLTADGPVSVQLPATGSLSIGRASGNDVPVDDDGVSRKHAVLHVGPPLHIEDLGSANGTWLRNLRVEPGRPIEVLPGEPIEIGGALLVVQPGSAPRFDAPAAAGAELDAPARGGSPMEHVHRLIERVAASDISVLITGETGAGKEVCARSLHRLSPRSGKPLLGLNCAALSESLLESELFGHERGAFTGALQTKPGLFESAEGGTLFLDEVGELPLGMQAKLLRVLDTREVLRVGATRPRPIDVRFVAATNRDLKVEVERRAFREDLFFRLNGFALHIPPLRERRAEIAELARAFVGQATAKLAKAERPQLSDAAIAVLEAHSWPGNVRELRNVIERSIVLCGSSGVIGREHLPLSAAAPSREADERAPTGRIPIPSRPEDLRRALFDAESARIREVLAQCGGNQTRAAATLGISRRTLVTRLREMGVPRPRSDN